MATLNVYPFKGMSFGLQLYYLSYQLIRCSGLTKLNMIFSSLLYL